MELICNGHFKQVFEICGRNIYSTFNKEFTKDKKHNIHYYIRVRYKNNSKRFDDSNTETLLLEFDPNLSTDFVFSDVDLLNETATEYKLIGSDQGDMGKTKLTIETQYTNENQELFVNLDYIYCETVGGTITKRLAEYKKAFDKYVEDKKLKTFKLQEIHIINQLGIHVYNRYVRGLGSSSERIICNQILVIFSILNDGCLNLSDKFCIYSRPWYVRDNNFSKFHECSIQVEYAESLKTIADIYFKNSRKVSDIFVSSMTKQGGSSDVIYNELRPKILELFNS